ncbi:DUF3006 domain-containing protein [Bacillus cereus group sp. BfR-BA-01445]|uniref:DUF3006 domain-containing protein n=1 Tax=Bacillus cereus group sp. BfR-BA-01445 TaxID=2920349 RepID=UPI001F58B16F|nr:DUF3006 domain-containing protein [Bacillus cereus group sp. BfR-BA-01445]
MKRVIIDRFEGELAVIEVNNVTMDVPKSKLPSTSKEGDVLIIEGDTYTIDKDETDKRRREIQDLMHKLFVQKRALQNRKALFCTNSS